MNNFKVIIIITATVLIQACSDEPNCKPIKPLNEIPGFSKMSLSEQQKYIICYDDQGNPY